jgi:hypothetical protein
MPGQLAECLGLFAGQVDEDVARRGDMRHVEDLVGETGQRAFGQRHNADRRVDGADRDGGMDGFLDRLKIVPDVLALCDAGDDGRKSDRHVGRDIGGT